MSSSEPVPPCSTRTGGPLPYVPYQMRTPLIFAYCPPCASDETARQTVKTKRPVKDGLKIRKAAQPSTAADAIVRSESARIYSNPDHQRTTFSGGDCLGALFLSFKKRYGARQACFNVEASDIHQ